MIVIINNYKNLSLVTGSLFKLFMFQYDTPNDLQLHSILHTITEKDFKIIFY